MSTNETTSGETSASSHSLRFTVLISLEVPSIIVSVIIFGHVVSRRSVRAIRHQHSMFVLLLVNFLQISTTIPMSIAFYHSGGIVRPATNAYCTWWTFYDYTLFTLNGSLMAWMSIERHLLIFHNGLLGGVGSWKRWSLHVGPWIVCFIWAPLFYSITIVSGVVCTNSWSFDSLLCGVSCHLTTSWGTTDILINIVLFVTIILTANVTLIIRVVYQRLAVAGRTRVNWSNQRKMVLQLVAVSLTYLVVWLPGAVILLVELHVDPTFLVAELDILVFLSYIAPLLLPFIYLASVPKLWSRLKQIRWRRRRIVVGPAMETVRRRNVAKHRKVTVDASKV